MLCLSGDHAIDPNSWSCEKQTAVSHSSTGVEVFFLDTGLCMNGLLALTLWSLVVDVLNFFCFKQGGEATHASKTKENTLCKKAVVKHRICDRAT